MSKMNKLDLISRADAIVAFNGANLYQYALPDKAAAEILESLPSADAVPTVIRSKTLMPTKDFKEWAKRVREENPNVITIPCDAEVVSAGAVSQSEQYKKGFEDAKRAFELEYARESENMRKQNAELEVMLNTYRAILADDVQGWIPLSHDGLGTNFPYERDGEWVIVTDGKNISVERIKKDAYDHFYPNGRWFELDDAIAWQPLPKPYIIADAEMATEKGAQDE